MKLTIKIDLSNSAFENPNELLRILKTVPEKVQKQLERDPAICSAPEAADKLMDINGNTVGVVRVSDEEGDCPECDEEIIIGRFCSRAACGWFEED